MLRQVHAAVSGSWVGWSASSLMPAPVPSGTLPRTAWPRLFCSRAQAFCSHHNSLWRLLPALLVDTLELWWPSRPHRTPINVFAACAAQHRETEGTTADKAAHAFFRILYGDHATLLVRQHTAGDTWHWHRRF